MVENKIAAAFTHLQPDRYRKRGEEGRHAKKWDTYVTVLIAPERRLSDVRLEAFDCMLSYEEVLMILAGDSARTEYKRRMIRAACAKSRIPWTKTADPNLTAWFSEARRYGVSAYPDLPLPAETEERAPSNKWFVFYLREFPQSRVLVEIKPHVGVVDLRFKGVRIGDLRRELGDQSPDGAETDEASSGKSVSIRIRHPSANTNISVVGQEVVLNKMFESANILMEFARARVPKIMDLLGYFHQQL